MQENYFYERETKKSFNQVIDELKISIENHGFTVLSIIDMQEKFHSLEMESKAISIIQLCNPKMSHHAISLNKYMVSMMPKDINVFEDGDGIVKIMFMRANTETLEKAFPNINISELSKKVGNLLKDIIDQVVDN